MGETWPHCACTVCRAEPSLGAVSSCGMWMGIREHPCTPAAPRCALSSAEPRAVVLTTLLSCPFSRRTRPLFRCCLQCTWTQPSGRTPKKLTRATSWMRRATSGSARPSWLFQQVNAAAVPGSAGDEKAARRRAPSLIWAPDPSLFPPNAAFPSSTVQSRAHFPPLCAPREADVPRRGAGPDGALPLPHDAAAELQLPAHHRVQGDGFTHHVAEDREEGDTGHVLCHTAYMSLRRWSQQGGGRGRCFSPKQSKQCRPEHHGSSHKQEVASSSCSSRNHVPALPPGPGHPGSLPYPFLSRCH